MSTEPNALPIASTTSIAPGIISTKDLEALTAGVEDKLTKEYKAVLKQEEFDLMVGFIGIIKDSVIFLGGKTSAGEVKRSINRKLTELIETDTSISPREASYINMTATMLTNSIDEAAGGVNNNSDAEITHVKFSLLTRIISYLTPAVRDMASIKFSSIDSTICASVCSIFENNARVELEEYYKEYHSNDMALEDIDPFVNSVSNKFMNAIPTGDEANQKKLFEFVVSTYRNFLRINFK